MHSIRFITSVSTLPNASTSSIVIIEFVFFSASFDYHFTRLFITLSSVVVTLGFGRKVSPNLCTSMFVVVSRPILTIACVILSSMVIWTSSLVSRISSYILSRVDVK